MSLSTTVTGSTSHSSTRSRISYEEAASTLHNVKMHLIVATFFHDCIDINQDASLRKSRMAEILKTLFEHLVAIHKIRIEIKHLDKSVKKCSLSSGLHSDDPVDELRDEVMLCKNEVIAMIEKLSGRSLPQSIKNLS